MKRLIPLAPLLLLRLLPLACLNPYLDPGPDPVHLSISFQAAVSPSQVRQALEENQLTPPSCCPASFTG